MAGAVGWVEGEPQRPQVTGSIPLIVADTTGSLVGGYARCGREWPGLETRPIGRGSSGGEGRLVEIGFESGEFLNIGGGSGRVVCFGFDLGLGGLFTRLQVLHHLGE